MGITENFSKVKVLVVGDIMLDRYWWGSVRRISPEAPVPIVHLNKTSLAAGGAANVAANIAGLGAEPLLIGVVGCDPEAKLFPEILQRLNVSPDYLVELEHRPTTLKTRVIAHNQQVVRIDQETTVDLTPESEAAVWAQIEKQLDRADILLISDYAKGVLTENLLARLIKTANESGKPILIDPKGKNYNKYKGATLLTPNKREAAEACGLEEDGFEVVGRAGRQLISELDLEAILITQGEEGMTLFRRETEPVRQKASARAVYDVTGAGDTVIATLAVALGAGANLGFASEIANLAAGVVVGQMGTTTIKLNDLRELIR